METEVICALSAAEDSCPRYVHISELGMMDR
jgi:hypothetical protein